MMSTSAPAVSAASLPPPTIPLLPEVRAAYENVYAKYEAAIETTRDAGVRAALLASQTDVDNVLTKDALYRLEANTALYAALLAQIQLTSDQMKKLQEQIKAISSGVSTFADVLAAIAKVLSFIPGA